MDVSEALKLLSGGKAFQSPLVRRYAVDVLRNASDEELLLLLLQLVQALRYEPSETAGNRGEIDGQDDDDDNVLLAAPPGESHDDDGDMVDSGTMQSVGMSSSLSSLSPLGAFLVERACASTAGEPPPSLTYC